jgi:orotate phosphoribosyltransferase
LSTGQILSILSNAYAATITSGLSDPSSPLPTFDIIFGPAYKGISFAATTVLTLHTTYNLSFGFAYDRKEPKDHGEGGSLVGSPIRGKKVLVLDDVMTAGTAIRNVIELVKREGGEVVGVVQLLDREEVGRDGKSSTIREVGKELGGEGRVRSILKMRDLMKWLEEKGKLEVLEAMEVYWEKYGVKD